MINALDHLIIAVSDLDLAEENYKLGLIHSAKCEKAEVLF